MKEGNERHEGRGGKYYRKGKEKKIQRQGTGKKRKERCFQFSSRAEWSCVEPIKEGNEGHEGRGGKY